MINLTINACDGNLYEITSRHSQPQSSAAQILRSDVYLTQRLIARLPIEQDTWSQVLARIGYHPAGLHSYPRNAIYEVVAGAVMRGDLNFYRLPLLDSATSLRGKNDIGLCIIKGPKPHCATHLIPEPIASSEAAQALLSELGIESKAVLAYLNSQNLYNSYDQQNPLNEVLKRLAKSELLAYKIPLPPMSVPEKAVECVPATGPGYDPVPLAPESSPSPKPTPPAPVKKAPPETLEEAEQRLIAAGPAVRAAKAKGPEEPLPTSSYTHEDKQAVIDSGLTEKYLVRVIETQYAGDEGYIGKVRNQGHSVSWTAPFSMVEHGDTDAEALLKAFGTRHTPGMEYSILIIDREKMNEMGDVQTVIPTKKNLKNLIAENPEISTLSPDEVEYVLNDELAPKYNKFAKAAAKKKAYEEDERLELAKDMGFSNKESADLLNRQKLADEVAAWEEFTGNGMTLDIATPGKTAYGPVEVVILDKKPMKLGQLKKNNALKSIAC